MIVVAIIGILAAIAIPLYANVQARARLAKAQADARALASAVSIYSAHVGSLPAALTDLTSVITNAQGQAGGPFLATVPPSAFRSRAARTMVLGRGGTWHPTSSESVSRLLSGTAQSLGYDRVRRAQDPGQASHLDWIA